jgi:hypothetical protein
MTASDGVARPEKENRDDRTMPLQCGALRGHGTNRLGRVCSVPLSATSSLCPVRLSRRNEYTARVRKERIGHGDERGHCLCYKDSVTTDSVFSTAGHAIVLTHNIYPAEIVFVL